MGDSISGTAVNLSSGLTVLDDEGLIQEFLVFERENPQDEACDMQVLIQEELEIFNRLVLDPSPDLLINIPKDLIEEIDDQFDKKMQNAVTSSSVRTFQSVTKPNGTEEAQEDSKKSQQCPKSNQEVTQAATVETAPNPSRLNEKTWRRKEGRLLRG